MNRYQVLVSNIDGWLIELDIDAESSIDALLAVSKLYADADDARGFHGTVLAASKLCADADDARGFHGAVQLELFNLSDPSILIDRR